MVLHVNMGKTIVHKETQAERKQERQKIGRLSDQKISPCTKQRYEQSLQEIDQYM